MDFITFFCSTKCEALQPAINIAGRISLLTDLFLQVSILLTWSQTPDKKKKKQLFIAGEMETVMQGGWTRSVHANRID